MDKKEENFISLSELDQVIREIQEAFINCQEPTG